MSRCQCHAVYCISGCSALYFRFRFSVLVCGDQLVEQYSRLDLTKDVYAVVLVCSLFIWRFLLKNPNNFCAFDVTLFMYAFKVMLDEMATPRYFAVSTGSRMCSFKMQLYLKGVLDPVIEIELHLAGWNCMPHCASLFKSFCGVSQSENCPIDLQRIQSSAMRRVCDDTAAGRSFINARKRMGLYRTDIWGTPLTLCWMTHQELPAAFCCILPILRWYILCHNYQFAEQCLVGTLSKALKKSSIIKSFCKPEWRWLVIQCVREISCVSQHLLDLKPCWQSTKIL